MAGATHIALLRAVNVGGTGKLPMAELRALAEGLGFARVRTLLASGNLLVDSALAPAQVRAERERMDAWVNLNSRTVTAGPCALEAFETLVLKAG